jgi:dTDP-4-dehydrorhamnose 3,5-epimerase
MSLLFSKASISGLVHITPHCFDDERGSFRKYFERNAFRKHDISAEFTELNVMKSYKKGILRGLHYQDTPSQARLFYVIMGSVFYVALDLRKDSNSFGNYEYFRLSGDCPEAVYIPENFAHGVLTLEDNTIVSYQSDGKYIPEKCGGILWNDSTLSIPWPIDTLAVPLILSEKDRKLQKFNEYKAGKL